MAACWTVGLGRALSLVFYHDYLVWIGLAYLEAASFSGFFILRGFFAMGGLCSLAASQSLQPG